MPNNRSTTIIAAIAQAMLITDNDIEEQAAVCTTTDFTAIASSVSDRRHGVEGRAWEHSRNTSSWFFTFALQPTFRISSTWKSLFRIPHSVFERVLHEIRPLLTRQDTQLRLALRPEHRLAAFLMYCGGASCEATGSQLGIGPSTVSNAVKEVSKAICSTFKSNLRFPTEEEELAKVMKGFENIRGLPYCVDAIDGTHIPWPSCPQEQFYEYRCYKGFTSIVVFAVVSANRRFLYADIGRPGVLGDSMIYCMSSLKKNIDEGRWLGDKIPDLMVGEVSIRPYLIGDCAFSLDVNMMKSSSQAEMKANPVLRTWDSIASQTRKPVECAFGMLKHRFLALKGGVRLTHEDDIAYMCLACLLLHNMCIDAGDDIEYLPQDEDVEDDVVTVETNAGKKQRDALLYYAIEKLASR